METGHRRGDFNRGREGVLNKKVVQGFRGEADFFQGGSFGFIGDGDFGEVNKGGERLAATFLDEIAVKTEVIGGLGEGDNGVGRAESLNNNRGGREMSASDASDDLGQEFEGFFFSGEVGKRETGVGLDDADRGEQGEVEPARDGLSTDKNVEGTGFNFGKFFVQGFRFFVISVETGDMGGGKKFVQLGFKEFSSEAFMKN